MPLCAAQESLINVILQRTKVSIWLYDNIEMRIEGKIIVCTPIVVNGSID